ncbi:D-alanine glycine permease [Alphaproteobacteria bacterium]|nr:D-alanine glycine permease [Alphaproteobacteria bacterium]GHS95869.1 D-alanine glycine permease [Alphaproteobacteria bacterium]
MSDLFDSFFHVLSDIDQFFWAYIGFVILFASGIYLTFKTKGFQFRVLGNIPKCFKDLLNSGENSSRGIHPIRLYFASVSGMVGLGNVVAVMLALAKGGPGALLWLWIACFPGMLVKYSEIYLGIRYRVPNEQGGYDGGPMFYLKKAFKGSTIPTIVSVLLCIYGVEVFQFDVISDVLTRTFHLDNLFVTYDASVEPLNWGKFFVSLGLLSLSLYIVLGGIRRLSQVCSFLMPIFIVAYVGMCLYIIFRCSAQIPSVLKEVCLSAFSTKAATGGILGSTVLLAAQQGISQAVYSGDIGIGYDSIIQAETRALLPQLQARLGIFSLLTDNVICSLSILVVLLTNVGPLPLKPDQFVGHALACHFHHADLFMAIFIFLAGFTTIIAYLAVGVKSAFYLKGKTGKRIYLAYAIFAFIFFSFADQENARIVMSLSSGLLVVFNLLGILKLNKFIKFK